MATDGPPHQVRRGQRIILRGPNGAGKSTLLKALSGTLPLAAGTRLEDERLRLGVFAQDLAQELPQAEIALSYVARSVRQYDLSVTEERCRTIMGSLGLIGDKGIRPIGALSGGEKARVALATFCLTPYNVLLLDEPTNHLDVGAIQALLDALDTYEGAIVVISHDRPFCEAVRATHVGYVCSGRCVVEERELRDADFSETDRGVRNNFVGDASAVVVAAPAPPPMSAEEAKRLREEQRSNEERKETLEAAMAKCRAAAQEAKDRLPERRAVRDQFESVRSEYQQAVNEHTHWHGAAETALQALTQQYGGPLVETDAELQEIETSQGAATVQMRTELDKTRNQVSAPNERLMSA